MTPAVAPPVTRELPDGFRVEVDPGVRFLEDGTVLVGGSPLRILRLTRRGADIVTGWRGGRRCEGPAELALARRFLDAGLAHPRPDPGSPGPADVTFVVPVRDRADALDRCLAALGRRDRVLVVDDASGDADRIAAVAAARGAQVIRRATVGGPAAARNTGLARVVTPYVAFVDSDCGPEPGWLETLLPHFQDPAVAAAAPRVVSAGGTGWIGRYDSCCSSLDRGPVEAPVVPRSRVAYVPAAALLVRRSAVGGGFDVARTVGEDVDLVWRLCDAGWSVRYAPSARVVHDPRRTATQLAARRFTYGTSAAPLATVHPGRVPPVVLSGWSLTAWALAFAGRPDVALGVVALASGLMARRLPVRRSRLAEGARLAEGTRVAEGARLAGLGTLFVGEALAAAVTQVWWPVALPAAVASRRARRAVVAAALARPALAWMRQRPPLDPVRFGAACLLDDLVYGAGVWWGCLRERTAEPLVPQFMGRIPIVRRPSG